MKRIFCLMVVFFFSTLSWLWGQPTREFEWEYFGDAGSIHDFDFDATTVWVGTDMGLVALNKITGEKTFYMKNNSPMIYNQIQTVFVEGPDSIWLGARGSVFFVNNNQWTLYDELSAPFQSYEPIRGITKDANGNYWFNLLWNGLREFDGINWNAFSQVDSLYIGGKSKMIPDKNGGLWLVENSGQFLWHYDGVEFKSVSDTVVGFYTIEDIAIDGSGNIWAVGDSVSQYNQLTGQWSIQHINTVNNTDYRCTSVAFDSDGNIWLWLQGAGLAMYNGQTTQLYGELSPELGGQNILNLKTDVDKNIWFSFAQKLYSFDGQNTMVYSMDHGVSIEDCKSMLQLSNNAYWFATANHLFEYDGSAFTEINLDPLRTLLNTSWIDIEDMEIGSNGVRWLLVNGNICNYVADNWNLINLDSLMLSINYFNVMALDSLDRVWAGAEEMVMFDGQVWKKILVGNNVFPNNQMEYLEVAPDNSLWFFAGDSLYNYNPTSEDYNAFRSYSSYILSMAVDSRNRVWLAPEDDGVELFDNGNWYSYYPDDEIEAVGASYDSTAWVVSYYGDIFNYVDSSWIEFRVEEDMGFFVDSPLFIKPDRNGNMWISYSNSGLIRLKVLTPLKISDATKKFPTSFSLLSNFPNPFNNSTVISFQLPSSRNVVLTIFNLTGQKVDEVELGKMTAGLHQVSYDAAQLPSGIYFYMVKAGTRFQTRKMILLK